jgi:hypothetical protein
MAGKALVTGKPQGHGHVRRGIIAKKTIEGEDDRRKLFKKPGPILTGL